MVLISTIKPREYMGDYCKTSASNGSPVAIADLVDLDDLSNHVLRECAEKHDLDLTKFFADQD